MESPPAHLPVLAYLMVVVGVGWGRERWGKCLQACAVPKQGREGERRPTAGWEAVGAGTRSLPPCLTAKGKGECFMPMPQAREGQVCLGGSRQPMFTHK